jgi:hypothetical protein
MPAVTRVHAFVHDGPTAAATAWTPADPPGRPPIAEVPGPPRRQDFLNRRSEVRVLPGAPPNSVTDEDWVSLFTNPRYAAMLVIAGMLMPLKVGGSKPAAGAS